MWMPSDQPLLDANVEELVLDWETIGRAIRECVLDAIEMKAAQSCVPSDETAVNGRANRRIGLD